MTSFFNKLQRGLKVCFAALCMLLVASPAAVHAYDFTDKNFGYNVISYDDLTCRVVKLKGKKYTGDITIPETVSMGNLTFRVTSIGDGIFMGCDSVTSIHLPASITGIGGEAFRGCTSLKDIQLPESLKGMGSGVFYGCSSLISLYLPDGITTIDRQTFYGCSALTSLRLPDGIEYILREAFKGCSSLPSLRLPDSIIAIEEDTFSGCRSLTQLKLPNKIKYIYDELLSDCTSLVSLELPESAVEIGAGAFECCSSLTNLRLPDSIFEIGEGAFRGCSKLRELILPKRLSLLGKYLINYVNFEGVQSIGTPYLTKLVCRSSAPATINNTFLPYDYRNTTLYVPKGSLETYKEADGWKNFYSIVEYDLEDSIDEVVAPDTARKEVGRYDLSGREVDGSHKGITIVRYDDGSATKIYQD